MERLRLFLIRWNVAPLLITAVMVWGFFRAWFFFEDNWQGMDQWLSGGLFTFMGAIAGLLFKIYDSLQKDRGSDKLDK